ncbi:MAG: PqqD family protein [Ignavibacteriales bacterium]|nr:PqqD family protein [Ignavibacteriales bacterium]
MKQKVIEKINLLDLKPFRVLQWERSDDEKIILLVPKFKNRYLVQWLMPRLKRPNFKVKLDEFGSFVWNHCDGNTTVSEISEKMKEKFGENFDPSYERIGKFISRLTHDKFLSIGN